MNIKELLKPNTVKIVIFLFIGIFYLYFAKEDICGVSFFFAFCYKALGFPFPYIMTGHIDSASAYIKTLFLGDYFNKYETFLFNPVALALDIIMIYLLSCFMSVLFKDKFKNKIKNRSKLTN